MRRKYAGEEGRANVVIRNDSGTFVAGFCKNFRNVFSNLQAKALVLRGEDSKSWLPSITKDLCTHVRRQANTIAHRMAHYSLNIRDKCEWLVYHPSFITDLIF
ncbi:hypothetical protein DVH24_031478 [Malus domestica]|uniref:RNase H type-1 domain-containing protein n=1 Tax=Malus domestica TaxID=3750 RepID=A0A498HI07_MALDO|nr:hypothetical protein DVH24_031478 [Malus domestica]